MKIGALGRTEILYNTILKLKDSGHDIAFIITSKEAPEYTKTSKDFEELACKLNIPFLFTEKINSSEIISWIKKHSPDIGVSVNWKTRIKNEVLNCFKFGVINAHAGDLPRYRGNAVPNWALLSGENKVVLTLHLMTDELDAGPILLQKDIPVNKNTYIGEFYESFVLNAPDMFVETVNGLQTGKIKPKPQSDDPSLVLRCYPRTPQDGEIDWKKPAYQIDRLIRASSEPFAGAYTFLGLEKIIVRRAHYEDSPVSFLGVPGQVAEIRIERSEIVVITGEGFIVLEEVETEESGRQKAANIIKSIRTRLGMDICNEIIYLNNKVSKMQKIIENLK